MLGSISVLCSATALALCFLGISSSSPHQLPFSRPSSIRRLSELNIAQGSDTPTLLNQFAIGLDRGRPAGWERLMHIPVTNGTFGIEIVYIPDLASVLDSWGLSEEMRETTYNDLELVIQAAVGEGVYLAQGFTYAWPHCKNVPRPVCLSTLMVVVKVHYVVGNRVWRAELGHLYMESAAEALEQMDEYNRPRGLNTKELDDIQAVLSTQQSEWAIDTMFKDEESAIQAWHPSSSSVVLHQPFPAGPLARLLKQFIQNAVENRDVFKDHKKGLLHAIQDATRTRRQSLHNMQLTVGEQDMVRFLDSMLSTCFKRAGIEEPVIDWWNRVHQEHGSDPISIECEFASQRKEPISPPTTGCSAGTKIVSKTAYSWAMIAPSNGMLDVLFMESNLDITYLECEKLDEDPSDDCGSLVPAWTNEPDKDSSGSVVRWAVVRPDGSFNPVQYLSQWRLYPNYCNKVMLDLLRFAAASAYLRIPVHQRNRISPGESTDVSALVFDLPFEMLLRTIQLFAETWQTIAKAFGSRVTETIQQKVCLGFDALNYTAQTFISHGISRQHYPRLIEGIIEAAELPDREDIRSIMLGITYSTNFTWLGESMIYSSPNGEQSFLYMTKHGDANSDLATVVYTRVKSNFVLAPDMLVVRRQSSSWGGLIQKDETSIEYVPHTLTVNDTMILQMFWEMIAFHQVAIASALPSLRYPDL
ncbi:hypothetical protein BGX28_009004, partial [Mortierella sp. GBA30]